ncbi:DNA translocase FtsK [Sporosarcina sp. GW1-11]|uniref:DNA translocase FtsK n=1 Tax=Sporosarcina sp. GW1-11 TaxID=2899126 RepID=UPI00294D396A|nr:DNA translocase FtsK [Sporosarcina sp. GW1-11]MDV6377510.1 DNA translocase FtsK [Sporosarcina sp. GW1-11]
MSWLRDMKRRLQQLEEGNKLLHELFDKPNTNSKEENNPPNFQFPIVSDHEIYGWEPQNNQDELINDEQPTSMEETNSIEDDYEIVPLQQNERWPGRYVKAANIYRADSRHETSLPLPSFSDSRVKPQRELKTTSELKPKRELKSIMELQSQRELHSRKEVEPQMETVKQERPIKMRRPFSPTHVPSPVYGYKKNSPIAEALEEIQLKKELNEEQEQANNEDASKKVEEAPFFASSTEKRESAEKADRVYESLAVAFEEPTEEAQVEQTTFEQLGEEDLPVDEVEGIVEDVVEEVELESELEIHDETDEVIAQEPQVEDMEVVDNEQIEPELESTTAQVTEEQTEQKRKEKIVPFNVMMLSSDKEKLALKNKPVVEETVIKSEIIQEKPSVVEASTIQSAIVEDMQNEVAEEEPPPHYGFPLMSYLAPPEEEVIDTEWLEAQSAKLEETLSHFAIQATVENAVQGPAVTMFELTVEQGVKVSKIRNLTDDLKLALAARDIRIQAPIPGTSMIGIEIPNRQTRAVRISEVINSPSFKNSESPLEAVLGLSLTGEPQTIDLRKMPHGMIAGATGSGKSVCINSILISLLYKASYHDLKLLLIDPKMVELAPYNGIPHLLSPVITDVKAATAALKWAVQEMERRYELFAHSGVRNIERYNEMVMESRRFSLKMPYILVVIDELADLMMMAPADVEVSISRITQKARACGIHLIIATQRPSVDVITGTIKANIPTRIAFAVSSQVDSRTILDSVGADRLLGKGDMLYLGNGQSAPVRLQGTFVTDDEIERIIEHARNEADPDYLFGQDDLLAAAVQEEETDPLFEQACSFIIEQGSASTSALQRQFSIGYNRAAKLIDRMEANQFISEQRGSRPRDVFLTEQTFENFMK